MDVRERNRRGAHECSVASRLRATRLVMFFCQSPACFFGNDTITHKPSQNRARLHADVFRNLKPGQPVFENRGQVDGITTVWFDAILARDDCLGNADRHRGVIGELGGREVEWPATLHFHRDGVRQTRPEFVRCAERVTAGEPEKAAGGAHGDEAGFVA